MKDTTKMREALAKARSEGRMTVLTPIEKAKKNPRSLRYAINAKCWDCSGEQRLEVKLCTVKDCALYPVRPYQPKLKAKE